MTDIGKRVYKAHKTLMQMLNDRGYQISDHDLNISLHNFKEQKI